MGSSESKNKEESDEGRVLDPFLIQWDANGHLRYGKQVFPASSYQYEDTKALMHCICILPFLNRGGSQG